MRKSDKELAELDDQSTDVFYSDIIERYSDRPNSLINNGAYAVVDNMCLTEFAAYYHKPYRCSGEDQNDNQPNILPDELLENQVSTTQHRYPKTIKLVTRKETMKCRNVKAVIRFHKPQKNTSF